MTQNEIVLAIATTHLVKIVSKSSILVQLIPRGSANKEQSRHLERVFPIELESITDSEISYATFITDPMLFANLRAAKLAISNLSKDEYFLFKQWQDDSRFHESITPTS